MRLPTQEIVKEGAGLVAGDEVEVRLHRGRLHCEVREVKA
jgi:serine kinase of HPr protein (carbohydrate metabolism regulator)